MDRNIRNTFVFMVSESDGLVTEHWCFLSKFHVRVTQNDQSLVDDCNLPVRQIDEESVKACDGSCKHFDVRAAIGRIELAKLREEDGSNLPSVLEMSDEVMALLGSGRPLTGQLFESWYAKRDSRGFRVCLDDVHVTVSTRFSRLACDNDGRYETHKVNVGPCDGWCRIVPVAVADDFLGRLYELEWRFVEVASEKK
jgi:hypothetical protein